MLWNYWKKRTAIFSRRKQLKYIPNYETKQDTRPGSWPPKEGEYILRLFTDGYYPGEIIKVKEDYVEAYFLTKASIPQNKKKSTL